MAHRQVVQYFYDSCRQSVLNGIIGWCGQTNHIRCEECCDDADSDDDRIEKVADDAQRQSQRGDDEREFTNLRHRESTAHGRLERLAAKHEGERPEESLTEQDGQYENDDRQGIAHDDMWVDEHAHRHEEDGSEEVFDGLYQLLYSFCLHCFCENATHDEGAEG